MNINRQKHKIVLGDAWAEHTAPCPPYAMLGTIQRGKLTGALAVKDDRFYCVIEGRCEPLNQELVVKALRKLEFAV